MPFYHIAVSDFYNLFKTLYLGCFTKNELMKSLLKFYRWRIAQLAEQFWWKKYLKNKEIDEYLVWKKKYWKDFLENIKIQPQEGQTCLDLGCGPAGMFIILDHQLTTAVDPLIEKYKNLKHFNPINYPNVKFIESTIENFETDKPFNLVFSTNAINHVNNWEKAFASIFNSSAKDGYVIISSDMHRYNWLKTIFRSFQWDVLHPQQHSYDDYINFIEENFPDFKLVEEKCIQKSTIFEYWVFVYKNCSK